MKDRQVQQLEDEINLLDYWRVIWKRKILISILVAISVFGTAIYSLIMTEIYSSKAVIAPVGGKEGSGGLSALAQQFGGLSGLSMPGSSSATEIVNLLKSNILRERVIESYNLLPVLFSEQWDDKKGAWKKDEKGGFNLNPAILIQKIIAAIKPKNDNPKSKSKGQDDGFPTTWDGLRTLNRIVVVASNIKENVITISIEFPDAEMSAKMVGYFITALNDHMRGEAKRVAQTNRAYLEEQLSRTADPLIRQKIYSLIASQVETAMMSELKENFAFKVIDPPKAPDKRIKPKRGMMVVLSFVASLFIGVMLAFVLDFVEKNGDRLKGASA